MGNTTTFTPQEDRAMEYAEALSKAGFKAHAMMDSSGESFIIAASPLPEPIVVGLFLGESANDEEEHWA